MNNLHRATTPGKGDRRRCAPRAWEVRLPAGGCEGWRALAGGELRMMLALESYARSKAVCWPGNAALASDCSCSEREVRRRLEALQAAGWIVRIQDRRGRLQSRAGIALLRRLSPDLPVVKAGTAAAELLALVDAVKAERATAPTDRAVHATHGPRRPPESGKTQQREKEAGRGERQETPAPARAPARTAVAALARELGAAAQPPRRPATAPSTPGAAFPSTGGPARGATGQTAAFVPMPRRSRDEALQQFREWAARRASI
jgi:hypothetical protein